MPTSLRTLSALTLSATALGSPPTHAGEPWPIERFVVEQTEERHAAGLLKDWLVDNTNSRFATVETGDGQPAHRVFAYDWGEGRNGALTKEPGPRKVQAPGRAD